MANRQLKIDIHEGPHKYKQAVFKSGTIIYRCGLTNCPHFTYEPLMVGKLSICWRCSNIFIITKRSLRSKKLHCEACTRGKYNKPRESQQEIISQALESDIDNILAGE